MSNLKVLLIKKCPACGKDHRSFKWAMNCYMPLKHIIQWMQSTKVPIAPDVLHQFNSLKKYVYSRFNCTE